MNIFISKFHFPAISSGTQRYTRITSYLFTYERANTHIEMLAPTVCEWMKALPACRSFNLIIITVITIAVAITINAQWHQDYKIKIKCRLRHAGFFLSIAPFTFNSLCAFVPECVSLSLCVCVGWNMVDSNDAYDYVDCPIIIWLLCCAYLYYTHRKWVRAIKAGSNAGAGQISSKIPPIHSRFTLPECVFLAFTPPLCLAQTNAHYRNNDGAGNRSNAIKLFCSEA